MLTQLMSSLCIINYYVHVHHVASSTTDEESKKCVKWVPDTVRQYCGIEKDSTADLSCSQLWDKVEDVSDYIVMHVVHMHMCASGRFVFTCL